MLIGHLQQFILRQLLSYRAFLYEPRGYGHLGLILHILYLSCWCYHFLLITLNIIKNYDHQEWNLLFLTNTIVLLLGDCLWRPKSGWYVCNPKIERLSYDLDKVFAVCFTNQCLARLKQSFSLFPPRKLLIWAVNTSIAQSLPNHITAFQMMSKPNLPESSMEKWHCLHPRSPSQWKFALVCFCSMSQLNALNFCLRSVFRYFSRSYESRSMYLHNYLTHWWCKLMSKTVWHQTE